MSDSPNFMQSEDHLALDLRKAVKAYWANRGRQFARQGKKGSKDVGARSEVTGGQHLNGIVQLLVKIARAAGFKADEIQFNRGMELPGYFRPQKKWDMVVTRRGRLCAAVELKSQAGSFGNNFNNRSEEAIGCSTDFWTAYREGALGAQTPWLGYFFLLEQAEKSMRPVGLKSGPFPPLKVFHGTSYAQRYAILCERLVLERKYSCATLVLSPRGKSGDYSEPNPGLGFHTFAKSLHGHLVGCA